MLFVTVPVMVRLGKVVACVPPKAHVPLKVTVPVPETAPALVVLFVQSPATPNVLFIASVVPLFNLMLLQLAAALITGWLLAVAITTLSAATGTVP